MKITETGQTDVISPQLLQSYMEKEVRRTTFVAHPSRWLMKYAHRQTCGEVCDSLF